MVLLCWHDTIFYPGRDPSGTFLNRMIKNISSMDIGKKIKKLVSISALITDRCSVNGGFLYNVKAERGIYRHYHVDGVARV